MGTLKQKKLAKRIGMNLAGEINETAGEMLANVGYSKSMAKAKPKEIINSEGVQEELKALGITVDEADKVVLKIMRESKKEENKLKSAEMIYKRLGANKEADKGGGKTLILVVAGETAERYGLTQNNDTSRYTETSST